MNATPPGTPPGTLPGTPPGAPPALPRDRALTAPTVSCVFVCHDAAGRVLLARRGAGARDEPGTWDTGAGALEHGETFEEAVTREVREEYSATALSVEPIGVRNILRGSPVSHWVAVVFAVEVDPAEVAVGEPHKFDALNWFAADQPPSPHHSQLPATLGLFGDHVRARAARTAGAHTRAAETGRI
ncbi:NUDIX domain-containing protein [Streptomyces sp. HNM0575]|uniref:NUDIX domain-containing protein n=1 Tax=Streptomyces sp. HNM0575 TaxID=2716338 RepID=UPI00145FAA6C|nr:NUDIX domain-containing protein [Streptomyces sp. HNM0575]NLU71158.1 NUDIX domain-containing protein [Streptomyces sp. HNM0575]